MMEREQCKGVKSVCKEDFVCWIMKSQLTEKQRPGRR